MIDIVITKSGRRYVVLIGPYTHLTAHSDISAYATAYQVRDAILTNTDNQAQIIDKTKSPPISLP